LKNAFFANLFGENIFKIIKLVPGGRSFNGEAWLSQKNEKDVWLEAALSSLKIG
jgi:hypothetical protein